MSFQVPEGTSKPGSLGSGLEVLRCFKLDDFKLIPRKQLFGAFLSWCKVAEGSDMQPELLARSTNAPQTFGFSFFPGQIITILLVFWNLKKQKPCIYIYLVLPHTKKFIIRSRK